MKKQADIKLITHNDLDGLGCAVVAFSYYPDISISHVYHNIADEHIYKVKSDIDTLFITDMSPQSSKAVKYLNRLARQGVKIFAFDHHKSGEELFSQVTLQEGSVFKEGNKCGTLLLWEFLYGEKTDPYYELVNYINEYDCGLNREYNSMGWKLNSIFYEMGREAAFEKFFQLSTFEFPTEFQDILTNVEKDRENVVRRARESNQTSMIGEYNIMFLFGETFKKHEFYLTEKMKTKVDLFAFVRDDRVSFRRGENNLDCCDIAKLFKGGGHPFASGATLPNYLNTNLATKNYILRKISTFLS